MPVFPRNEFWTYLSSPLVLVWLFTLIAPVFILNHSEFVRYQNEWIFASLDPSEVLFGWTRNRLILWFVLFCIGAYVLIKGIRNDAGYTRLTKLSQSTPGKLLIPFALFLLIASSALLDTVDVILFGMFLFVCFTTVWMITKSVESLKNIVGNSLLSIFSSLTIVLIFEIIFRHPAIVEQTGGSHTAREHSFKLENIRRESAAPKYHWQTGSKTILALGDSFTFGDWIPDIRDTWPHVMEGLLNENSQNVSVVRAGIHGSDTAFQAEFLNKFGWSTKPEILVLQYTLNDIGRSGFEGGIPLIPILGRKLGQTSYFYNFADNLFRSIQRQWSDSGFDPFFEDNNYFWIENRKWIKTIADDASTRNVPLLFILFPWFDSPLDAENYKHMGAHNTLKRFVESLGVPFIDLRKEMAAINKDPRSWWVKPFDFHPNVEAHRIAGRAAANKIKQLNLMSQTN